MGMVSKSASDQAGHRFPVLFYRSAREGFEALLKEVLRPGEGVLLPAFIGWSPREGSGVFDPVRTSGAPFGFYGLNTDLTVNLEALRIALASGKWRILVLIHYWGRTEPWTQEVRKLADQYGVLLVEDLAHGFYGHALGRTAGRHGSVNLFSLHKMFPISEGGMVQYRDASLLGAQRETMPELAHFILQYDWRSIAEARRQNYSILLALLSELPERGRLFDIVWPELSGEDVPQSLPLMILNGSRDALYSEMNERGFGVTSLYHTLIEQSHAYPEMQAVARQITNLPVHQDVNSDALEDMVATFRSCLGLS